MYKVKMKLSCPGYKDVFYTAVYIPKEGQCVKVDDIKEKMKNYLLNALKEADNRVKQFTFTIVELRTIKADFFILDDNKLP